MVAFDVLAVVGEDIVTQWVWRCGRPQAGALAEVASEEGLRTGVAVAICTIGRPDCIARLLGSLAQQTRSPEQLIVIDAGTEVTTEAVLRETLQAGFPVPLVHYARVRGRLRGLTRQRNFALLEVTTDLVAFFDDDVVLRPTCLQEMEKPHRAHGEEIAGVAAFIEHEGYEIPLIWRIRFLLRIAPTLRPGTYHRAGLSTPWGWLPPTQDLVEGDWIPGGVTVWKTAIAREIAFLEEFGGYALGEDLEFSLRARRRGRLFIAGAARALHLHEPSGRPDAFRFGFMEIYNKHQIHRRVVPERTGWDRAWFFYAWTLDTVLVGRCFLRSGRWGSTFRQIAGRLGALLAILRGR